MWTWVTLCPHNVRVNRIFFIWVVRICYRVRPFVVGLEIGLGDFGGSPESLLMWSVKRMLSALHISEGREIACMRCQMVYGHHLQWHLTLFHGMLRCTSRIQARGHIRKQQAYGCVNVSPVKAGESGGSENRHNIVPVSTISCRRRTGAESRAGWGTI